MTLAPSSSRVASFSLLHFFPAIVDRLVSCVDEYGGRKKHTSFLLREDSCMGQSHKHRSFSVSYAKLALETAHDVLGFEVLTCSE